MSEYTKGPWEVNVWSTGRRTIEPMREHPVYPIAEIHLQHNEAHKANARLIASSPELLEACKKALAFVEQLEEMKIATEGKELLNQAISKAEGKNA